MEKEGQYIYCIIDTKQERNFGPIGLGGEDVLTLGYNDLSMVVSSHPLAKVAVSRANMLAHQKVVEEVMREFDSVLPARFGSIAASADEIRNLLDRRCVEFKTALRDMDHKIELGVKGRWLDMAAVFKEITDEHKEIRKLKEKLQNDSGGNPARKGFSNGVQAKMEVGRMVAKALAKKKEQEAEKIVDALRRTASDCKLNQTFGDEMFINAAFLVDKGRVKEFDNIMDDLNQAHKDRIKFAYAGPLPVYNFVTIEIHPEQWEK